MNYYITFPFAEWQEIVNIEGVLCDFSNILGDLNNDAIDRLLENVQVVEDLEGSCYLGLVLKWRKQFLMEWSIITPDYGKWDDLSITDVDDDVVDGDADGDDNAKKPFALKKINRLLTNEYLNQNLILSNQLNSGTKFKQ